MAEVSNWPISVADARRALGVDSTQYDDTELQLYCTAACEHIDTATGRDADPTRHVKEDGSLPALFVLAARETVKLWWQQAKSGPRGFRTGDVGELAGPPMGADLPRKVQAWLADYPREPGIA